MLHCGIPQPPVIAQVNHCISPRWYTDTTDALRIYRKPWTCPTSSHPKRVLAWQGRRLRPPVASHRTRASRPWTCAGALPLRPPPGLCPRNPPGAFVLLGTMTGAFLPLDPDRGFAPGPYPMALPSEHPPRALAPFGNHASEPSCSDTMTGGLRLLRPPRAEHLRSPREGARPLRRAGASGARGGMSGAVKARQHPADPNDRSLP